MNFDFKFQVFPSHQDRKTNSSVFFWGEVMARQFISRSTDLYKYMQFDKNWLTEIWVNTVADSFDKIRQLLISLSDSACKKGLFHINFLHIFFLFVTSSMSGNQYTIGCCQDIFWLFEGVINQRLLHIKKSLNKHTVQWGYWVQIA